MSALFSGMLGGGELILILVVVLMLFGSKKMPELARGLGQGIKEFKKASREVTDELQRSMEEDHRPAPPQRPSLPASPAPTPATETAKAAAPTTTETKA